MTITVDAGTITDLTAATSATFNSMLPIIVVIIAVPLAFYALRRVISLFPKR